MPQYKFERTEITTETEIRALVEADDDPWFPMLVSVLYLFGCRISEALSLRRRNVWVAEGMLVAEIGVLKRRDTKKGPYARIPHLIHVRASAPFVNQVVIPYLEAQQNREAFLFPSPTKPGSHISRVSAWKHLKAKEKEISPHVFRHDRLMKLAMKGGTEAQLMDWAGWTDSRPASSYIRATGRLAEQLANAVD